MFWRLYRGAFWPYRECLGLLGAAWRKKSTVVDFVRHEDALGQSVRCHGVVQQLQLFHGRGVDKGETRRNRHHGMRGRPAHSAFVVPRSPELQGHAGDTLTEGLL